MMSDTYLWTLEDDIKLLLRLHAYNFQNKLHSQHYLKDNVFKRYVDEFIIIYLNEIFFLFAILNIFTF